MSDTAIPPRPAVRYAVRWRKLPEFVGLLASVGLWAAYLIRGGF